MKTILKKYCSVLFIIAICFCADTAKGTDSTVVAKNGIADLRKTTFDKSLPLKGEWSFAWDQLITPNDKNAFHHFTEFPRLWEKASIDGEQINSIGYASYGLTILLPAHHESLAMYLPVVYSSYKLYVNGTVAASNGITGSSKKEYQPQWVPLTIPLPANTDTVQLILQVANFSHAKGGANLDIMIGESKQLFLEREKNIGSDFMLAGCLFMGGLFFLGLYLFGTKDKATLFFSLFCLVYSYRMVGSSFYALHAVFPSFNWEIAIRLEYCTLFISIFFFLQYVRNLYPDDFYKPIVKALSGLCLLLAILPLFTAATLFTKVINPFLIIMFFCIGYLVFVFTRAYTKRRVAAEYALASVALIMLIQLVINLEYFGIMMPSRVLLFIGYVGFFFLQSLILAFRFAYTLKQAKMAAELGLQAKSEFLSTMSHEIRTPLNSVIGMSNIMLRNDPRPDQKEQLNVLQFSANNLLGIVNDILDYNKIEAGKITFENIEMDIPNIVKNVVAGFKNTTNEKGINLKINIDGQIRNYVMGDPTRLTQVLHNLVGNAVKFTREGSVTVNVIVKEENENGITLLIKIEDTGIGIAKEKQQLIFERFTQADSSTSRGFGGTGLGLAITQKIIELQGSRLQLESELGKGAAFFFIQTFPLGSKLIQKERETEILPDKNTKPLKETTILLVEDNQLNILVAKTFLQNWGATVDVANNGQEAIDSLDISRHKIVLMDLHMPVMDGFTAIKTIREKGLNIPIIALTASLPAEVELEIKGLDINGFVLKPFVPDELLKKVLHFALNREPALI